MKLRSAFTMALAGLASLLLTSGATSVPAPEQLPLQTGCFFDEATDHVAPDGSSAGVDASITCKVLGITVAEVPVKLSASGQDCDDPSFFAGPGLATGSIKVTAVFDCAASSLGSSKVGSDVTLNVAGKVAGQSQKTVRGKGEVGTRATMTVRVVFGFDVAAATSVKARSPLALEGQQFISLDWDSVSRGDKDDCDEKKHDDSGPEGEEKDDDTCVESKDDYKADY